MKRRLVLEIGWAIPIQSAFVPFCLLAPETGDSLYP